MRKENILNIPNVLTILRMLLVGVFIWLYTAERQQWALAVFLLAGFTDLLDGYIARKQQLITDFGKLMDPLADKLMAIAALFCLVGSGIIPFWIILLVILKELIMVAGSFYMLRKGIVVQARWIGKISTVVFIIAIVAAFFHDAILPVDAILLYLAVALSYASLIWYIVDAIPVIKAR